MADCERRKEGGRPTHIGRFPFLVFREIRLKILKRRKKTLSNTIFIACKYFKLLYIN